LNNYLSIYLKVNIILDSNLNFFKVIKKCTILLYNHSAGWIDINNLAAKVPLVGGSIYVKILKVKSNAHNKMFNIEKLAKVGLGNSSSVMIDAVKSSQVAKTVKINAS